MENFEKTLEPIDGFLEALQTGDAGFALSENTVGQLLINRDPSKVQDMTRADVCITCDAPRDVCETCDTIDCVICDAPNDVECPKPANDKCQWCTMRDPGAPADAG